ncbi:MAG: sigma-70 family RNA polymerase sigma factor [Thermoflexales bacterium]|nr:sigma-70 family RNA polymerase sigma factor [Thermoflexales bacterium]
MTSFSEDGRLILRVRAGDVEALGSLYEKYKLTVFRAALAIVRDQELAEDILQETFLRLGAHVGSLNPSLPLAPWLYRVAVNLSYTNVSRGQRWLVSVETFVNRLVGSHHAVPEDQAELREIQRLVWQAIDGLEADHRMTVILYYVCDLSQREIAYAMDCPLGTVKSRLHYGRTQLRQALSGMPLSFQRPAEVAG